MKVDVEEEEMFKFCRCITKERKTLIDVVAKATGSKKKAKKVIDEGLCAVNGIKERFYRKNLKPNTIVEFSIPKLLFTKAKIEILYEDEYFLVVNKPPFINSNKNFPDVENLLRKRFKSIYVVHRLDKQTSGALIIAKSKEVFELFKLKFKKKEVKKKYLALVAGNLKKSSGEIKFPIDGKEAISRYQVVERVEKTDFLEVEILTGRKHQIRKHFASVNHPLIGEFVYWKRAFPQRIHLFSPRIMLHAKLLKFKHPIKEHYVEVKAPLFEDFKEYLKILKGETPLQILTL
ncbi:RluA family pseudouridine synthase [Desulfurobacterium thermolithotrophum]|uniref:RluA family pseudouridine synthase n=1 Tax=Desulfurobacterium thermolithotrophum TaxID=64160 RepID=UPI0039852BD7